MKIEKGLLIKSPAVDNILSGRKTSEMRSAPTKIRGTIGLIRSKSGTVIGVVDIVDCKGPFSKGELLQNESKHLITPERLDSPEVSKYKFAWVMANARLFSRPVPYRHPAGAVIWVSLEPQTSAAISGALS